MNDFPSTSAPSPTTVSETEIATPSETNNRRYEDELTELQTSQSTGETLSPCQGMKVYDYGASDMELRVNNTLFKTHQHLLNKFAVLGSLITDAQNTNRGDPLHVFVRGRKSLDNDFYNMFGILYASVIEGPFDFPGLVLVSGLRLATTYDYRALRTFCRHALEELSWAPIQLVKMGQEFGITSWIESGCQGLGEREKPITQEEAKILGIEAFVRVAQAREERQKRLVHQATRRKPEDKPTTSRTNTHTRNAPASSLEDVRRISKLMSRLAVERPEVIDRDHNMPQPRKPV